MLVVVVAAAEVQLPGNLPVGAVVVVRRVRVAEETLIQRRKRNPNCLKPIVM